MRPKVTKTLRSQKRQIKKELCSNIGREDIEEFLSAIEADLVGLYERTTANWRGNPGSSTHISPKPEVFIKWDITFKSNCTIDIEIFSQMQHNGKMSDLWYWIDRGVSYTTDKKSAPFPWRSSDRTYSGGIDPGRWDGVYRGDRYGKDKTTVLPAGWPVVRPGTDWTGLIGKEFKSIIKSKINGKATYRTVGQKLVGRNLPTR